MALDATTTTELTQEQVQKILVQPLEKASVFLASGVRIFDTNGSAVRIPKQAPPTAPAWHGENEQISEVNPDFGEVILLPDTMKSVKVLVKFSNELARQSVVSLDAALRQRLVTDVAATLDTAFIASTVVDGTQPTGILNYAGRQSITAVGAITIDDLHDAEGLALAANVDPSRLRWFMTSRDFVAIRKLREGSGTGQYLVQPDPTESGAYRLLGHPVTVTNRIPDDGGAGTDESTAVLFDPSQVAVARDLAPTVKILDQTFGDFDQMAIRVVARYDAAPLNAEAVVTLEGITP
ncbi:phage major capsid protein [Mycobacteroides abscessus]|uniref:phage major capsid protein n=1 Tax=Mycobacteroides abscessus TaxID=36809 RepID=UPI000E688179|nr:phage major capsid protein [Mycobacteroides abscessus]RIT84235.1 phage major capsid protein [Mycobacteroides abscessus]